MLAKTAMIIDDDDDLGLILSAILESRKVHALAVNNLDEAEECLRCARLLPASLGGEKKDD